MATTVYVEVRPNVRACNFFFKTSVKSEPSVKIGATEVEVYNSTLDPLRLKLPTTITLLPESQSGLTYSNDTISFRAQIATFNAPIGVENNPSTYSLDVQKNERVKLLCSACHEHLSSELSFSRILPLPSTEEFNDFFCHRHSEEISLDPNASDLFYNFFFVKMNVENLNIPEGVNQLNCPRCSTYHGEIKGKCVKLWTSTVRLAAPPFVQVLDSALDSFLKSLKYFVKDIPIQMNKFVFKSQDNLTPRYTLIWILDRSLVLLSGIHRPGDGSITVDVGNVMKVLYRHYKEVNKEVNEWLDSFSSSVITIPPKVELELLSYLAVMSEKIPSDSSTVNGMSISYLQSK